MAELAFSENVNFAKLAASEASYKTKIDPSYMPRLKEACKRIIGDIDADFKFYIDLQGLRTIEGSLKAKVCFICQRCQKEFTREVTCTFLSTCDEEKARSLRIDDRLDIVELNADGSFDLLSFLEDCLLLEIPFITSHEEDDPECEASGTDWTFGELSEEAEKSPFSELAQLKEKLKK